MKTIRPYEMSVWTLRDSYLATLKAPGIENKGQIEEPEFSLKNDGTQEIKFNIPMYYWHNNEFIENPYWYDVKHGLLMTGLRKIKLIFNKRTDKEEIFEFLVTKVEELHDTNRSLYCSVVASCLAFQELGKRGYNISLSSEDFIQEYNDYLDALDEAELTPEEYEEELNNAPKENISYWCDKVFENVTDWDYSIQMNWTNYDGYIIVPGMGHLPFVNVALVNRATLMDDLTLNNAIEELNKISSNYFDTYNKLSQEEQEGINNYRESLGLRRNDTIYEDDYVASWNVNVEAQTVTPATYEKFKEKWRPVDAEKSNIYNLTQTIAETFGVYCKYKYYYDDNYHIIKKEVIFYNNFVKDLEKEVELTYGYGLKKVKRVLDSNDIFTKMIVENVEDDNSETGLISILNTPANVIGENYLLNFDYLYETGSITEDQYLAVADFEKKVGFYNQQLKEQSSFIIKYQQELNDLKAEIAVSNNMITQAQTQIEQALSSIAALTENEIGIIDATGVFARFQEDGDGNYYIKITEKGVIADDNLKIYTKYDYITSTGSEELTDYNVVLDSNGNIEKLTNFNITKEQASSTYAYLFYKYRPQMYYENVINTFLTVMKKNKLDLEINENLLKEIEGYLTSVEDDYNQLLVEKQKLIADFENLMGPAIREGNWQPGDYKSLYSLNVLNFQFSNEDIEQEFDNSKVFWDTVAFDDEFKGYYKEGIVQNIVSFPCIKLDNLDLLEALTSSFDSETEDILRYSYETITSHTGVYEFDEVTGKYSYSLIGYNDSNTVSFEAASESELENKILEYGLKIMYSIDDVNSNNFTNYQIQKVRERFGLTIHNRKYFNFGDDLNLGYIKDSNNYIIPVLFLDTEKINENDDITFNGKFCYRQIEVTNDTEVENNISLSTIDDLSDIPTYTDYTNCKVDEKIVDLVSVSSSNFLFNYKDNGWTDVYPRIAINNLSLNDNSIEISSITNNVVKHWNKYEDYSVLIRDDNYFITFDAVTLLYNWIYGKFNNNEVTLQNIFNIELTMHSQISNAELSIYLDAKEVSKTNAYPQVSYEIEIAELNEDFIQNAYQRLNQIVHINDLELKFQNVLGYISDLTLDLEEPWKDKVVIRNYKTKFEDLFSKIVVSSQQMQANAAIYDRAASAFGTSGLIKGNILQESIDDGKIALSFLDKKFTIDQINGILAKSDDGVLMFNNNGIFSATGKNEDGNWIWNSVVTPFGINAGLLKAGTIDTNLIRIYAGDNLRFQMNSEGLYAFKSNEDGTANQNEYVVHNSEGLFLVNKKDNGALINRVEVSWNGLVIRDNNGQSVFYADNSGNLILKGIIQAGAGFIGGWNIVSNGLYSGAELLINSTAGMASGLIIDGQNQINGAGNNLYKVFWAGRTNDGNSRFYVDSNGDLFVNSAVVSQALVTPQITIGGIHLEEIIPELSESGIAITALDGYVFRVNSTSGVETNILQFTITGQGVIGMTNLKLQKYLNNSWTDVVTTFNGTTHLTFGINYDKMNNGESNTQFRLVYNKVDGTLEIKTFTLSIVEIEDTITVDITASPTNNFNNNLIVGSNENTLVLFARVFKNGIVISNPEDFYDCQWYRKEYNNNTQSFVDVALIGETDFILEVEPADLINKRSATYVCEISEKGSE